MSYPHCERIFGATYSEETICSDGVWLTFLLHEFGSGFDVPKSACDEIERMGTLLESWKAIDISKLREASEMMLEPREVFDDGECSDAMKQTVREAYDVMSQKVSK